MNSVKMSGNNTISTTTASTERIQVTKKDLPRQKFINPNLISLKCLIFFFFGGMGCLFPFLPLHMQSVGLTIEEIRLISMISPAISIIGPLLVGPIADKLARSQVSAEKSTGRYLRVMIAICCVMAAILYSLLVLVPVVNRIELPKERRPDLTFSCDRQGARIFQERCKNARQCHVWSEETIGTILLQDCNYVCNPIQAQKSYVENPETTTLLYDATDLSVDPIESSGDIVVINPLLENIEASGNSEQVEVQRKGKRKRYVIPESEPPHLCFKDENGNVLCHVYTKYTGSFAVNATLMQATNAHAQNEWCSYPVAEFFSCRIPHELQATMFENNQSCTVECGLTDPYTAYGSVLAESQCGHVTGDPETTFWMYLGLRSAADVFSVATVALIDAAIVIATRETSCGRGDVGRQLAFGSLGFTIFGPLTGYATTLVPKGPFYYLPIGLFALLMLFTVIIALSANGMPLSPPEWWWHTRSGMLALPMSAVKRYGCETAALFVVLIVMGTFWSAMDSYLPLHLEKLDGNELSIGISMTVGALPAVLFLWKSENLVDYCGHSNLLILAFTVYIVRFTGLSLISDIWCSLISEALELFTLGIMWVTAILYMRHLVPRHWTVTAQALPVIAHFCIGRCLGGVIGAYIGTGDDTDIVDSFRLVYRYMAIAAAIIAAIYFVLYHGLLKPRCHAQTFQQGTRQPPTLVQAAIKDYEQTMNGNGNYTPLRVYHNGMAKKGQFRY